MCEGLQEAKNCIDFSNTNMNCGNKPFVPQMMYTRGTICACFDFFSNDWHPCRVAEQLGFFPMQGESETAKLNYGNFRNQCFWSVSYVKN